MRKHDRQVAVLSIDPSSPFTRGALLGDRIRLSDHFLDSGVFIRSMASRGALGGLSEATLQAALLMDASGKDDVLIETVGVGQAEIDIVDHGDTVVLVLMPGSRRLDPGAQGRGDGDPGHHRRQQGRPPDDRHHDPRDPRRALPWARSLAGACRSSAPRPRAARACAELAAKIVEHREHIEAEGTLAERRARNLRNEVLELAAARLRRRLEDTITDPEVEALIDKVVSRELDPASAAGELLERNDG